MKKHSRLFAFIRGCLCLACLLVAQCGTFNASYTDPKTGAIWHGGVDVPKSATSDNKSTVNDGP